MTGELVKLDLVFHKAEKGQELTDKELTTVTEAINSAPGAAAMRMWRQLQPNSKNLFAVWPQIEETMVGLAKQGFGRAEKDKG